MGSSLTGKYPARQYLYLSVSRYHSIIDPSSLDLDHSISKALKNLGKVMPTFADRAASIVRHFTTICDAALLPMRHQLHHLYYTRNSDFEVAD